MGEDALSAGLRDLALRYHGYRLEVERARRYARMLEAAARALEAAVPPDIFDTEPADLTTLLEGGDR